MRTIAFHLVAAFIMSAMLVFRKFMLRATVGERERVAYSGVFVMPQTKKSGSACFSFHSPVYWIKQLLTHTLLLWRRPPRAKGCARCARIVLASCFYISFRLKALKFAQVESSLLSLITL